MQIINETDLMKRTTDFMNETNFLNETNNISDETNRTDIIKWSIHNDLPCTAEYFPNLTTFIVIILIIGLILYVINLAVYYTSISQCIKRVPKQFLYHTIFLLSAYPIVCTAALIALFIPKSIFISHTIMHLLFTICVVVFYKLCFLYSGGEEKFLKENDEEILNIKTPPCCCCCICIHNYLPTVAKLQILQIMNLQFPPIQFIIMITLNWFYFHAYDRYETLLLFFAPFMIASILTAMWSLNIATRMINSIINGINLLKKMMCLQLILILCKLQFVILEKALDPVNFGGIYPITNTVYKYAIINLLILLEMIPLSIFAKHLYKVPTFL